MFNASHGILSVSEMNLIRDAHLIWCASNSLQPDSPSGQAAAKIMFEAYRTGTQSQTGLITECDRRVSLKNEVA